MRGDRKTRRRATGKPEPVKSKSVTVAGYLKSLPPERRAVLATLRRDIRAGLPKGYRECVNWGMICYEIPLSRHADTYNGKPLMDLALKGG